jgi:magnesium transporter
MLVDSALYVDGRRTTPATLGEAGRACREPGKFAWVTLHEPTEEEFLCATEGFGLDELAVEDATKPHQSPKLERYGDGFFMVLKPARYVKGTEKIELGEIHAFVHPDFIVTLLYGEDTALDGVREEMEGEPERLRQGPSAILYEIMQRVVEGYVPVVEGIENDIDEVEAKVLDGNTEASRSIHKLFREVIRFHQATKPLAGALERLVESGTTNDLGPEARRYLRRIRDRIVRVTEQIEGFRDVLSSILDVNLAMVGVRQNDQMQKISAWGAVLIVPTLIAGIFGMNFENAQWQWFKSIDHGFELSVAVMALISFVLYLLFKRAGYL